MLEGLKQKLGPLPVWAWGAIAGVGVGVLMLSRGKSAPPQAPGQPSPLGTGNEQLATLLNQLNTTLQNQGQTSGGGFFLPPPALPPPVPVTPPDEARREFIAPQNYFENQLSNLAYNLGVNPRPDLFTNPNEIFNHVNLAARAVDYSGASGSPLDQQIRAIEQLKAWLATGVQGPDAHGQALLMQGWLTALQNDLQHTLNNPTGGQLHTPTVGVTDATVAQSQITTASSGVRAA